MNQPRLTSSHLTLFGISVLLTVAAGLAAYPIVFAGRISPGILLGPHNLTGLSAADLAATLEAYRDELSQAPVPVTLRGQEATVALAELGYALDAVATNQAIDAASRQLRVKPVRVKPIFSINEATLRERIQTEFRSVIKPPQNASLVLAPDNGLKLIPGASGEGVDTLTLEQDIIKHLYNSSAHPIPINIISVPPAIQDHEVERAQTLAQTLLADGIQLHFEDDVFVARPFTIRRLLEFVEQVDPQDPANHVLGVRLNPDALRAYLANTVAPKINQEAINARLEIIPEPIRVVEFASPQRGLTLDVDTTAQRIAGAITVGTTSIPLIVDIEEPLVGENTDIKELGITTLLARGESNFVGSPNNRVHNIEVGASRYHGLLIPPGEEFSFNQHLGPVSAAAGFKPELVIKQNKTVPEYGGGLCQVSTTAFRAAIHSGLEITQRRNHSYAVQYYGTPGFDATIYPGYTDLRFRNNTPGHILVQTKVEGTRLIFDFWGTKDGRLVEVKGPAPYSRQADGAVKATLTQKVINSSGETIIDETFYSNYKSPQLFPKQSQPSLSS